MAWVSQYSNANMIKTDFFEARKMCIRDRSITVPEPAAESFAGK